MSAILDRLLALATTGVGSLPFARPAEAARHALGGYAVPFCPQLPRLDGDNRAGAWRRSRGGGRERRLARP